jgi:hypothetical protein
MEEMMSELNFLEKYKDQLAQGKTVIFDEFGKVAGFVSYPKPSGHEGFDCPVDQLIKEETLKEKLKRLSRPKLIEIEEKE